jgi:antitoxin VapB
MLISADYDQSVQPESVLEGDASSDPWAGVDAIVAQLHRIPPRPVSFEAVEHDDMGLPK